ncbi:leucine-rich repeat domain-containing protein [Natranaerobius thermophilus]|uniref:Leucine-rich repeat protein n=1 Tax=Natranaerobius thermophilus (strain ATCC BAA-1301 / DSM 18059 / JW/NM-WN-LF) TaxID=457570 RepID=B2A121_NATTJ|nr:leucine-rich repeat domain-containing protein [Natranaerobius thermophilus]ACB84644.1 leucine-rich repeat protein [Natranaerobius thermophilus JW/NM-WN-LF]
MALISGCSSSGHVENEKIIFEDSEFEKTVKVSLGYFEDNAVLPKADDDKEIYLSDLKDIEKLSVHPKYNEIENIAGIEHMENLKVLELNRTEVSNIDPLKSLRKLEQLTLRDNQIEDIKAIENLNKLRFLDLANNSIDNIDPVKNLNNLEVLNLSNNEINDITPIKELEHLEKVYMKSIEELQSDPKNMEVIDSLEDRGVEVICD